MCDFIEKNYIPESIYHNMFERIWSLKSTLQQKIDKEIIDDLLIASKYFLNVERSAGRIENSFPDDLRVFHFERKTVHSKQPKICWKQEGF